MEENLLRSRRKIWTRRGVIIIFAVFFEVGWRYFRCFLGWLLGHPPLEHFAGTSPPPSGESWPRFRLILDVPGNAAVADRPAGGVKRFCDTEVVPLLEKSTWSEIALISLSAGVGEEMLFRGVLQASLERLVRVPGGSVLASMLFGLFHPISVTYMVMAAFLAALSRRRLDRQRQPAHGHGHTRPSTISPRSAYLHATSADLAGGQHRAMVSALELLPRSSAGRTVPAY